MLSSNMSTGIGSTHFSSQSTVRSSSVIEVGTGSSSWVLLKLSKSQGVQSRHRNLSKKLCLKSGSSEFRSNGIRDKDGIVIVDHGSRRKESNLMLNEFVTMFRDKTRHKIVEPAHMELAEPSIITAFEKCVEQGASRVIVSPFFLFPGRHWHQDIPALTAEAAKKHPGVPYLVTAPLGLHELLVDVVNERIEYCLSHVAGDAEECAACVGTGKCKLR